MRKMNKRLGLRLVLVGLILFAIIIIAINTRSKPTENISNVTKWLQTLCDAETDILDDKKTLTYLSKCINSFKVINVEHKNDMTLYSVQVNLTPYNKLEELTIDADRIIKLKSEYLKGNISDSDIKVKLKDIYLNEEIENCYKWGSDSIDIVLVLSENNENGVTYESQVDFINRLLTDSNILNNLRVYESNIRLEVRKVLVTP